MNYTPLLPATVIIIATSIHLIMMLVTFIMLEFLHSEMTLESKIWTSFMWMVVVHRFILEFLNSFDKKE